MKTEVKVKVCHIGEGRSALYYTKCGGPHKCFFCPTRVRIGGYWICGAINHQYLGCPKRVRGPGAPGNPRPSSNSQGPPIRNSN